MYEKRDDRGSVGGVGGGNGSGYRGLDEEYETASETDLIVTDIEELKDAAETIEVLSRRVKPSTSTAIRDKYAFNSDSGKVYLICCTFSNRAPIFQPHFFANGRF